MTPEVRVVLDPHASPDFAYRAHATGGALGFVDAAGPTPDAATTKVLARHRLRWLGVEWVGMAVPDEARQPTAGQVATNGYRYALWRQVGPYERLVHWIMLNPSSASATADDATMRRVCEFSRTWGFGWVTVGNLWPYRASKPTQLHTWLRLGGEWISRATAESDRWVLGMAKRADLVVVAWGAHGSVDRRDVAMLAMLESRGIEPHALALTKSGCPRHPLRMSAKLAPEPLRTLQERRA